MTTTDELEELERRRALGRQMGGEESVAFHHGRGKLTVRERLALLVDDGSLREFGYLAGSASYDTQNTLEHFTPRGEVNAMAQVDGRKVVVSGGDFTVRGGSASSVHGGLGEELGPAERAREWRLPYIRLLDAAGGSVRGFEEIGRTYVPDGNSFTLPDVELLNTVPVVSAVMGSVAGLPAVNACMAHWNVMVEGTSQIFPGGPPVVKAALGYDISKEELGGPEIHTRVSGCVDNLAAGEEDALAQIRRFLSYLPPNVWELPPVAPCDDPAGRQEDALLSIIPRERRRAYKVRKVIGLVVDHASFFEITGGYGRTQVTGLARVKGQPVGVIANDGMVYGGGMSADGATKIRRFAELCDAFHLPIVSLVDEPGFMIGPDAERAATIRHGMEAMFAVLQTRVPWLAFVLRRSFGVAQGIHFGPGCTVLAWPSMQSGALPVESGVHLAFGKEIAEAGDPEARRRELEEEMFAAQSVHPRAEEFGVHDLIDPRKSRPLLCEWIDEIREQLRQSVGPRAYSMRP